MATEFGRTLRSIRHSGPPARVGVGLVALALAAAWTGWFFFSKTHVYTTSSRARVEVSRDVHVVQAPVAGVVTKTDLALGKQVAQGDVLVVIESTAQALELESERARLAAAKRRRSAIGEEIATRLRALEAFREANSRVVAASRGRLRAASVDRSLASKEYAVMGELDREKIISRLEGIRSESALERQKAAVNVAAAEVRSTSALASASEIDREAEIAELTRQRADADSEVRVREATIKTLQFEVERRTIRAATSGTLADVRTLTPGATLTANEAVASIVPESSYRIVAYFPASSAVGRVRPGQKARVRLDPFPWVEYGAMEASVSEVSSEAKDGVVRSELRIDGHDSRINLSHGLAGSVEVETEAVSPASLVLRTAGYWIVPRAVAPSGAEPGGDVPKSPE